MVLGIKARTSYILGNYSANEPHPLLDRASQYISGQPVSCYMDQADLKLREPPASASQMLGIKTYTITSWLEIFGDQGSSSLCWSWTHCVAVASRKLEILLPPPSNCLDYRCATLYLVYLSILSVLFLRTAFVTLYLEVRVCYSVSLVLIIAASLARICVCVYMCIHIHNISYVSVAVTKHN